MCVCLFGQVLAAMTMTGASDLSSASAASSGTGGAFVVYLYALRCVYTMSAIVHVPDELVPSASFPQGMSSLCDGDSFLVAS